MMETAQLLIGIAMIAFVLTIAFVAMLRQNEDQVSDTQESFAGQYAAAMMGLPPVFPHVTATRVATDSQDGEITATVPAYPASAPDPDPARAAARASALEAIAAAARKSPRVTTWNDRYDARWAIPMSREAFNRLCESNAPAPTYDLEQCAAYVQARLQLAGAGASQVLYIPDDPDLLDVLRLLRIRISSATRSQLRAGFCFATFTRMSDADVNQSSGPA